MKCFVLRLVKGKFRGDPNGVVTVISSAILKAGRVCLRKHRFMRPRKVLDAVPTVTRMVVNFMYKQVVVSLGSGGSQVRGLFFLNSLVLFTKFLFDCAYPLGGHL